MNNFYFNLLDEFQSHPLGSQELHAGYPQIIFSLLGFKPALEVWHNTSWRRTTNTGMDPALMKASSKCGMTPLRPASHL